MRTQIMRPCFLLLGLGLFGAACAGDSGDDDPPVDCSKVTGTDTYFAGLPKAGRDAKLDYKLMSAMPAPPARGDNTWVVQITTMASGAVGTPLDDADVTVTPFMPAHQHGSPIPVEVTPTGEPGTYTLEPVNLWMPGVWETTITAASGTTTDSAIYKFCIE
jgi:hypothetical protein